MNNIKIKIPTLEEFKELEFGIKSSFDEFDAADLKAAAARIFADAEHQDEARGRLFFQLCQLEDEKLARLGEWMQSDDDGADAMVQFFQLTDFVMKQMPVFGQSLFPTFRGMTGPADYFENLTWWQFSHAEVYYAGYLESLGTADPDTYDLDKCLAHIYWTGTFEKSKVHSYCEHISKWSVAEKHLLFLNYMAMRNDLLDVDPEPKPVEEKEEVEKDPIAALQGSQDSGFGDAMTLPYKLSKIEDGRFGTMQEIFETMVPDVMIMLEMLNTDQK